VVSLAAVAVVLVLVIGGYFGLCAWVKGNGLLLPGTTASGLPDGDTVDLSKLSADEATELLESHLNTGLSDRILTITYGDGQSVQLDGSLLTADPSVPVASALEDKENQPFYKLGMMWLGMSSNESDHEVDAFTLSEDGQSQVKRLAAQIAQDLYIAPVDSTYEVTDTTVEVTRGTDGQQADQDAIEDAITQALLSGETALSVEATPLSSTELTGESLSQLVYVAPQAPSVGSDGKLTPTVVGHSVDAATAQSILDETAPGEVCSIPLTLIQPDVSSSSASDLLYQDLLASSDTYMAGTEARRTNIRLAAKEVNGTILMPGETFSYNNVVGERTAAKGYKAATVYVGGQDKQELGGGICQLASALYYCTFYANLEVVFRTNHRFAVTYVPRGLDATVAWGSLDYKFKNNTNYPIKITAVTEGNTLYVKFYGTKENDNYVKEEINTLSTTPSGTVYQVDSSLSAGQTKETVHAYTGYKVEVYRCVYDKSGKLLSRTFENTSTYSVRDKVVAVSPADASKYGLSGGSSDASASATVTPSEPVTSATPAASDPPVNSTPPADTTTTDTTTTDTTTTDTPATDTPTTDTPTTDTSADDTPAENTPAENSTEPAA
jgi:vancomycin resistance protein YoaR